MRYRLLMLLDATLHRLIPQWIPWPRWAWRICQRVEGIDTRGATR